MSGGLALEQSLTGVSDRTHNSKNRSAHWSTKLTRPLTLKCGDELVTLRDARVVMALYAELGVDSSPVALAMKWLSRGPRLETSSIAGPPPIRLRSFLAADWPTLQ